MLAATLAGFAYFAVVFAAGFALGTFRILVLVPRFGEFLAVLVELPVILAVSWFAARWLTGRFAVPASLSARLVMGAVAFVLLMTAEAGLSVVAFGRTVAQHLETYGHTRGLIGLFGQILFALIPAIRLRAGRK